MKTTVKTITKVSYKKYAQAKVGISNDVLALLNDDDTLHKILLDGKNKSNSYIAVGNLESIYNLIDVCYKARTTNSSVTIHFNNNKSILFR